MYSILIVDDERMIRNGLRDLIPWQSLGISQVYTAASGREALSIVEEQTIHIVLTDICMPEITGIALIEHIRRQDQDLPILVLTGYDDFEYAQQCCKMHVQDFILKPIDEDTLMLAIQKQIRFLEEQKERKQYQKILSRAQGIHDSLRLERTMRKIAHAELDIPEAQSVFREYPYLKDQAMQVALLILPLSEGENWQDENAFHLLSIKNICLEMVDMLQEGVTFEDVQGKIGVVFFLGEEMADTYSRLEQINTRIKDERNASVKMVQGSVVQGFSQLPISYNDAIHLLQETGQDVDIRIHQNEQIAQRMNDFYQAYGELKTFICANINDEEKLAQSLLLWKKLCDQHNLSLPFIRRTSFEFVSSLYYAYLSATNQETNLHLDSVLSGLQSSDRKSIFMIINQFAERLCRTDKQEINEIVCRAKQYIHNHLHDDLSVSSIAAYLYVNSNYFSRLFKKASGEGCNEYITRKRIEKAKILLETSGLQTGKIAEMIGYRDKNYFSLTFKKLTGFSPTQYRQNFRQPVVS